MKKRMKYSFQLCCRLIVVVLFAGSLTACDDNDQWVPGDIPGNGQTALYSNKLSAPVGGNELTLTYSGQELIGKEVALAVDNAGKATFTLKGILPGEGETPLTGITLTPIDGGYTFSGNGIAVTGTAFKYSGKVKQNKLSLNLTDVITPANALAGNGTWFPVQTGLDMDATDPDVGSYMIGYYALRMQTDHSVLTEFAPLLGAIGGNLLTWYLGDLTFKEDGNIVANYGGELPDDLAITDILMATVDWNSRKWFASPQNLITFYMENDTTVYITPNIDMIIRQIKQDQLDTRAENTNSIQLMDLLAAYKQVNKWTSKGIKFTLRANAPKPAEQDQLVYGGDYFLFVDKQEIEAFLPFLGLVKDLMGSDPSLSFVGDLIDQIVVGMKEAKRLEIGIMLDKKFTPHTF